jgi:glycosyltransferase involved in cell wall biosynthesis
MRLAISNHALRHSGGIERYALTIVRGLHGLGVRPTLIAKAFDTRLVEYSWVEPIRVRVNGLPSKLRDLVFDWRIRRLKRRHDLFPLIACNQTGAADIAICGSTHPGFLEAMRRPLRRSDRWKIALERAHLQGARVIVAHSRRMADEARRFYGVAEEKIRLLYPPIDGKRFAPVDDATRKGLRDELSIGDARIAFLLVSTGHERKGLEMLVEFFAATTLPVTLLVAGRPLPGAAQMPNVRSLGYRADIENVYRAVDFTVLAARYEPFGLVGVESVLCGTPVLLARGVGCAEVIREPAQLPFDLDAATGAAEAFAAAVDAALALRRAGRHRLEEPRSYLRYDCGVEAHVSALLELARALVVTRGETPAS